MAFHAKNLDKNYGCAIRPATPKKEEKAQDQILILVGPSACYNTWTKAKRLTLGTDTSSKCGQSANRLQVDSSNTKKQGQREGQRENLLNPREHL